MPIKIAVPKVRHIPNTPVEITDLAGRKVIGIFKTSDGVGYSFSVYVDGAIKELYIPDGDFEEFNVHPADNYIALDNYANLKGVENKYFLRDTDGYNVKLLGYCTSVDEDDILVCDKVYFQIHDRYVELSVLYLDTDINYATIKESTSPYDFEFYKDDRFELYTPYDPNNDKPSLAIVPKSITGEELCGNEEALECADECNIMELASEGCLKGINYGSVALLFGDELFTGKFYINFADFRSVTKEDFLENSFGIKQIENSEMER